jgi:hypothetical protein
LDRRKPPESFIWKSGVNTTEYSREDIIAAHPLLDYAQNRDGSSNVAAELCLPLPA